MTGGWTSNDWSIGRRVPAIGEQFTWSLTARVVIPCNGNTERLESVLAALAAQTYPSRLTSVVVVDDASEPPLCPLTPETLNVRVVRPWQKGAGVAAARAAAPLDDADVAVFIDADMLPESHWLEAHMRWHHVRDSAVVVGFRRHVARTMVDAAEVAASDRIASLFSGEEYLEPEWFEAGWRSNEDGLARAQDLWRLASGGNLSVNTELYRRSGGIDAGYWSEWGGEDNEFAYRLYVHGGLIIPERAALAWHLGLGTSSADAAARQRERSRLRLASRVPSARLPRLRNIIPETPRVMLQVRFGAESAVDVVHLVDGLLGELGVEVAVELLCDEDHPDREFLGILLENDSRVTLRTAAEASPPGWQHAHVTGWIASTGWTPAAVAQLVATIEDGETGFIDVIDDGELVGQVWLTRLENRSDGVNRRCVTRISALGEWLA